MLKASLKSHLSLSKMSPLTPANLLDVVGVSGDRGMGILGGFFNLTVYSIDLYKKLGYSLIQFR